MALTTIGELLEQPQSTLLAAPNFSRRSLAVIMSTLREFAQQSELGAAVVEPTLEEHPDWLSLVRSRLHLLRPDDRLVFIQRSGLDGTAPETLAELGDKRGVTRERIRQLEARALKRLAEDWWPVPMRERLYRSLDGGVAALDRLASEPFFSGADESLDAFAYVVERLLDEKLQIVELEERLLLAPIDQRGLDKLMATLRREIKQLAFPIPQAMVHAVIDRHARAIPGLSPFALDAVLQDCTTAESADGPIIVGFGSTRGAAILGYLKTSAEPVSVDHLCARFGPGAFPAEVLYFDRGVVGLSSHMPDFDTWTRRLVPLCIANMMAADPSRQWTTVELLDLLSEQARLPTWMNAWHLAALLRVDGRVRYLGRLRVALDHDEAPTDRKLIRDVLVEVLRKHGAPMTRNALIDAVRIRAACTDFTFQALILNPPCFPLDVRVGLIERDLPGGEAAMLPAMEALVAELERVDRGLTPSEALAVVRALGDTYATWSSDLISATVRQSGTAILNRSGTIGLAGWPAERLPTRQSVVREMVDTGDGQVSIEAVTSALEARFGTPTSRTTLYNIAQATGARLRGKHVIDERLLVALAPQLPPDLPDPLEIVGFPAAAIDVFQAACAEEDEDLTVLRQSIESHVAAYVRQAEFDSRLASVEVHALAHASRALLDRAETGDPISRRLAIAAVRYFVKRNDAEMDFEVGGLDDDTRVLNAIANHLGFDDCFVIQQR